MSLKNTNFEEFRADVNAALAAVAEKYGCDIRAGKIKYDDYSINISIDFNAKGENGESGEQVQFNQACEYYGFKPEHYKKPFVMDEKIFYLTGFNSKARKYHCVIADSNGATYGATIDSVKLHLGVK